MLIENCETQTRSERFVKLYEEVFPKVAVFIRKMGGDLEDTKDVFQDALIIYYEKTTTQDFVIRVDDNAYLIGICKHLWFKKQRQDSRNQKLHPAIGSELGTWEEPRVSATIMHFMERAGKKCMDLLQSFYFEKRSMANCGQPLEKILKDFNRDYWISATEAVSNGIVDAQLSTIV